MLTSQGIFLVYQQASCLRKTTGGHVFPAGKGILLHRHDERKPGDEHGNSTDEIHQRIFTVDERVGITNYSPFRGVRGTIQRVNAIVDDAEDRFCFYLIALDSHREPIWFEHREVESLDGAPVAFPQHRDIGM